MPRLRRASQERCRHSADVPIRCLWRVAGRMTPAGGGRWEVTAIAPPPPPRRQVPGAGPPTAGSGAGSGPRA